MDGFLDLGFFSFAGLGGAVVVVVDGSEEVAAGGARGLYEAPNLSATEGVGLELCGASPFDAVSVALSRLTVPFVVGGAVSASCFGGDRALLGDLSR